MLNSYISIKDQTLGWVGLIPMSCEVISNEDAISRQ
jgi:hypothetical protein